MSATKIDPTKIPYHIAIIMDGNGRWAKQNGKPRVAGHRRGVEVVRDIVSQAAKLGVKVLTLFAFSEENWGRPHHEVTAIMALLDYYIVKERVELNRQNISFRTMGRLDRLSSRTQKRLTETKEFLQQNTGMILNVALSYGGRSEIVEACRRIGTMIKSQKLDPSEIDQDLFNRMLDSQGISDPDLLIRTSGEERLSNFLLWQSAYTELYFTSVYWPDFDSNELEKAIFTYQQRQRRFGLLKAENNIVTENDKREGAEIIKLSDALC